jgi:hypothetical protein
LPFLSLAPVWPSIFPSSKSKHSTSIG